MHYGPLALLLGLIVGAFVGIFYLQKLGWVSSLSNTKQFVIIWLFVGLIAVAFCTIVVIGLVKYKPKKPFSDKSTNFTLGAIPLICIASIFCSNVSGYNLVKAPVIPLIGIVIFFGTFFVVRWLKTVKIPHSRYALILIAYVMCTWMGGFSNSFDKIRNATISYLPAIANKMDAEKRQEGTKQTPIIFKNPKETNIEARKADLKEFMVRISGSPWGCILALLGYLLLVILYPELIVAIPFIGIGVFALKGGHRFTIHAVPIAAMAAVFLPLCLLELVRRFMKSCKAKVPSDWKWPEKPGEYFSEFGSWIFAMGGVRIVMLVLALALIWPNIKMARDRSARLGTVLQQAEVQLLDDIHKASNPGDYVHTWWDWGTAVWYHAERNVLTHPGNQSPDTFVCAKMLMTGSPRLSAHLGVASAEYYHHKGGTAVHHLFKDANTNQPPSSMLKLLEEHLPVAPTRDTYLYLPYRLIQFYSVLESFSERELIKGEPMPRSEWIMCGGYRTDGAEQVILMHPVNISVPIFHVDLKTFAMAELHNPVNAHNIHRSLQRGINPLQKLRFIAFHLHDNQQQLRLLYAHANSIRSEGDSFVYNGVDGKQGSLKLSTVKSIYPASRIKRIVTDDPKDPTKKREGQATGGDFEKPGLSLVILQNPRLVLLADDKAYASQLMKLLVLDQPDPKYFERVSANVSGRVFRIQQPTPPDP